jgi:hypothetical protein
MEDMTMKAVANTEAKVKEIVRKDGIGRRRDYIGSPGTVDNSPQAFLVERPYAGARINPHFHDVDQFQVVVKGDGAIGKKQVKPVTFQYADAYTPYGPIVARDDGISFFTLRNVASGGHFVMPGSKHLMVCRAGRNIAGVFEVGSLQLEDGEVVHEALMEPQADGVDAVGIRLGANAQAEGPASNGGGQYILVCGGTLLQDGKAMKADSLIRVEAGEPAAILQAGPEGADVLVMQFSRPSDRPGSDPSRLERAGYVDRHIVPKDETAH